jgi:hypothetical protein
MPLGKNANFNINAMRVLVPAPMQGQGKGIVGSANIFLVRPGALIANKGDLDANVVSSLRIFILLECSGILTKQKLKT